MLDATRRAHIGATEPAHSRDFTRLAGLSEEQAST
jgi:hypothetical protein